MSPEVVEQLVGFATRSANSHNTQPWRFQLVGGGLRIAIDPTRRCPVVDPEDRHVVASLGCATENLVVAGAALGVRATPTFDPLERAVAIDLTPCPPEPSSWFDAIPQRQSTRRPFDPEPLPLADVDALLATVQAAGVHATALQEPADRVRLSELVVRGHEEQVGDPAFVKELVGWIRFHRREAQRTRDGLFTEATGHPSMPSWLGRALVPWFLQPRWSTGPLRDLLHGTPLAIVLGVDPDGPASWFGAGRVAQRLQLEATARGLCSSYLNQAVEAPQACRALADWLGHRPVLILRFGHGTPLPSSFRRTVQQVMDRR